MWDIVWLLLLGSMIVLAIGAVLMTIFVCNLNDDCESGDDEVSDCLKDNFRDKMYED